MKHFLIVVDMQKDFVDGALGTREAQTIVPAVAEKIRSFSGEIFATLDTHGADYLSTKEGQALPVPHCIKGTPGWELNTQVAAALHAKGYNLLVKSCRHLGGQLTAGGSFLSIIQISETTRTAENSYSVCFW